MTAILIEVTLILLLLFANGVFAMSEMAIVSARKARLQQRARSGSPRAMAALELAEAPSHFLSTVQIGITLVGILAGAFGGATIAEQLAAYFSRVPVLAEYSEALALAIVVLSITYLSLIIGELVPKRIALHNPERVASAVAIPMRLLSKIASPAGRMLSASTEAVLRLLGIKESDEPPITEDEIKVLIEQGIAAGVFEEAEREMIESVFHLGDLTVDGIMTPRTEVVWLDVDDSIAEIKEKIKQNTRSRYPVVQGSPDNVIGMVRAKDLLAASLAGGPLDLKALLKPPLYMPENMPALKAIDMFKKSRLHSALVVDEYGGIEGIVTVNDILEALVGEMPSIYEPSEQPIVQRADGSWLVDGGLPVDEFKDTFQIDRLPKEEQAHFRTLNGFIVSYLGRIPAVADQFEWGGYRFEVMDMDRNRVDKVLVTPPPPSRLKKG
jgi:putative hemolysin